MIRLVSASALRYFSSTGGPTVAVTSGRSFSDSRGSRELARPHLLGAPQPDRDHRCVRGRGEAGGAPPALELGVEEGRPAGDRPFGGHHQQLADLERGDGGLEGLVRARAAIDADAAHRLGQATHERDVEQLLLAQPAHVPTRLGEHEAHDGRVEVGAVVEHHDRRAGRGDVLDALDLDTGVRGDEARPHERAGPLLELRAGDLG